MTPIVPPPIALPKTPRNVIKIPISIKIVPKFFFSMILISLLFNYTTTKTLREKLSGGNRSSAEQTTFEPTGAPQKSILKYRF